MTPLNKEILETWNFGDPAGSFVKFNQVADDAQDGLDRLRYMTQAARCLGLQRNFDGARQILADVEAAEHHSDDLFARFYLESGRVLNSSGKREEAIPLFEDALEFSKKAGADYLTIDAVHMLAIAHQPEKALEWGDVAMNMIEESDQEDAKKWTGPVLNNHGWNLADAGRWEEALAVFRKSLAYREEMDVETPIVIAKYTVAHALRKLDRFQEALDLLIAMPNPDGFCHEEIAESLTALGKSEEAKPHFAKAYEELKDIGWVDQDRKDRIKQLSQ